MFDMIPQDAPDALALTALQRDRLEAVAAELDRLNETIRQAVNAGLSVELHRSERYHCGGGCWGDMMRPVVVKCR